MRNVMLVAGTRPELIKLAPLYLALKGAAGLRPVLCLTAQHREMSDQVLEVFQITPDFDLNLMRPGQTLSGLAARVFEMLPGPIADCKPACVVVQGDTLTAWAGAQCAYFHQVPVAHVEAGLRSGDLYAPFPEEGNRRGISAVARWNFAPTQQAAQALLREGHSPDRVFVTGNTVVDALLMIARRPDAAQLPGEFSYLTGKRYLLVTGHRRESFGEGMLQLCEALKTIASRHPEVEVVYPVHPNPNVTGPVRKCLGDTGNIHLVDPVDYPTLVGLLRHCYLVLTDSGGIQEEAPALDRPVLVTREVTERPEGVDAGCAQLVGTNPEKVVPAVERLLGDPAAYAQMAAAPSPFGDGSASLRITQILEGELE